MNKPTSPPFTTPKTVRNQHDLRLAAHAGWLAYVFPAHWMLTVPPACMLGVTIDCLVSEHGHLVAAWHHLLGSSGFLTWGLGFLLGFRLLFRSIDRAGRRKTARALGMIPPPAHP